MNNPGHSSARMALLGRIGGTTTSARHDPKVYTAKARTSWIAQLMAVAKADDPTITDEEALRRAIAARRAHLIRIGVKGGRASAAVRSRGRSTPVHDPQRDRLAPIHPETPQDAHAADADLGGEA